MTSDESFSFQTGAQFRHWQSFRSFHRHKKIVYSLQLLPPRALLERIAALVLAPSAHHRRYFGVLAPNSQHSAAAVARAQSTAVQLAQAQAEPVEPAEPAEPASTGAVADDAALGTGKAQPTQAVQPKRPAHCLWAVLMARIYEVLPLLCPLCGLCGGQMRIIAFITHSADNITTLRRVALRC